MDLTPEEREKIYLGEKARIEAQSQIKAEIKAGKSAKANQAMGIILVIAISLVGAFLFINFNKSNPTAAPEPEHSPKKAYIACQPLVRENLKAPATAKFPEFENLAATKHGVIFIDKNTSTSGREYYLVSAYVDSQNSFGAMIRTEFQCTLVYTGNGKWELSSLKFL